MSFPDLSIKSEYRSLKDDVVKDFFIPTLSAAVSYKRSVGFFSSTALELFSKGLCELAKNGGQIELVASPYLSAEDEEAIRKGYENREKIIENALLRNLQNAEEIKNPFAKERLNLLANLIESGVLNIKIAFTENESSSTVGMYHEKLGIIEDEDGNRIAFSGSMNESGTALTKNYEAIDIFCSWKNKDENSRVVQKLEAFSRIWGNYEKNLRVVRFQKVEDEIITKYKHGGTDFDLDKKEFLQNENVSFDITKTEETLAVADSGNEKKGISVDFTDEQKYCLNYDKLFFHFFDEKRPRDYQLEAISKFKDNNYKCLFAMATGTGKTLTSLFAVNNLCVNKEVKSILILVPLKDLVEQWNKDVSKYFDGNIILIHSGNDWKEKIRTLTIKKMLNPNLDERLIIISTYDSFSLNKDKILKLFDLSKTVIIADECHKTGANTYRNNLPSEIPYRIGLSATPRRPYDLKGTKAVFEYFDPNNNPYEFTIEMAINRNMLCPYNYHPIFVELTINEMEDYAEITERINKLVILINSDVATEDDIKKLEQILKQRHRIIERAENKFNLFSECFLSEIKKYTKYTIVFAPDGTDKNNEVILSKYKDFVTHKAREQNIFLTTVEYVQGTDKKMLEYFENGQIDIVFAKQRLNEGIDIPAARRAFFVSSSTSEREFIQRRGRVLRLCDEKKEADIFDFVVVAPEGAETHFDKKICNQIKESELKRVFDFAKTAQNFSQFSEQLNRYM